MRKSADLNRTTSYHRDNAGSVGIAFAIAAIPLLVAVGAAMDYSRSITVRQYMQASADAAALSAAAASKMTDAARIKLAEDTFNRNFAAASKGAVTATPQVELRNEAVTVSASVDYPTTLMKLAGIGSMELNIATTVDIPEEKTAEIALVLDYSGSMKEVSGGQVKYVAMRNAASDLVQDIVDSGSGDRVKFGLVPFSHHVRVSLPGEFVVGGKKGTIWTGCTQDRPYPYNIGLTPPDPDDDNTKWGQPQAPEHIKWGCGPYAPKGLTIREISDDHQAVIDQLQSMQPYIWTHISLGFEFGWHLLDKSAPFTDVEPKATKNHLKYLVLLTDGRQTEPAFGPGGSRNTSKGEQNLETMCESAKQDGITIVTVAFDLKDKPTENRLRNCATDPAKNFFIAEDSADLAGVFDTIKKQIAQSIYISK